MLGGTLAADPAVAGRLDVDFVADSLAAAARFARTIADALPESDPDQGPARPDQAG
jgi:hypothetical protein